jgi:hypothetical protein
LMYHLSPAIYVCLMDSAGMTVRARIAGLCYLVVIAGGLFAEVVARGSMIVPGDAAATAEAIAGSESLWRWGLAVHLLYLLFGGTMTLLIYELFKPVHATLARLALVFGVISLAIEGVSLLQLAVPLVYAEGSEAFTRLDEGQRQASTYLAVQLFSTGFGLALMFFAGFCALTGVLILRSRYAPRVIGALMIAAGGCYLVNTLALLVSPALAEVIFPLILLPCFVAELSLALWLTIKGVASVACVNRVPLYPAKR